VVSETLAEAVVNALAQTKRQMRALNLGCGDRFHPNWENLDFVPANRTVKAHDLRRGIPYPNSCFDVVYHSHVLEHFSKVEAPQFLRECFRVLAPSGIIRVVVPDLECIARLYVEALEKASQGLIGWDRNYEWMVLEMYDQAVREKSGGDYTEYFRQEPFPNWNFVSQRLGVSAEMLREFVMRGEVSGSSKGGLLPNNWAYMIRNSGTVIRNKLIRFVLGEKDWNFLQLGRFRKSGEIHLCMYDSYSLASLLRDTGFSNSQRQTATESRIPNWSSFHLDFEPDGRVYKADSLYMEAFKP
jgi:predicted SAM-dependent methyltransferase